MVASVNSVALALVAIACANARAHVPSHDNILRIQLWDAEGLTRDPITTQVPSVPPKRKLEVNLESLNDAMLEEWYGSGKFTKHRVRHKRRRPRHVGDDSWRFHRGDEAINVLVYDPKTSWDVIESDNLVSASAVSGSASSPEKREVSPPRPQRLPEEDDEVKQLPVVPKCCASGQNLSVTFEEGKVKSICTRSSLTFQPAFHQANDTHIWSYDSNVYETIVGNPCAYDRYRLEPDKVSTDEFYLLVNGSLFVPFNNPPLLGTKEFCMETFYNEINPAGKTLPLVCFTTPADDNKSSVTLIVYAVGLIISVPFLLTTAAIYLLIEPLRTTHGKVLACHTICLAVAFSCLAATQLAGHAFPVTGCTIMAYLIQFSFVSCFFFLNALCLDIYLSVRTHVDNSRIPRRRFTWYCVYAILLPVILLTITIVMDLSPAVPSTYLKPNFGVKGCWFKTDQAALPYFYGPVALVLVSNIIIFCLTARKFKHYRGIDQWTALSKILQDPDTQTNDLETSGNEIMSKYKKIFRTCCVLSIYMGISWAMEVVSWAAGAGSTTVSVWSVFDLINAMQGVVIFCLYVLPEHVRNQIRASELFIKCRTRWSSPVAQPVNL